MRSILKKTKERKSCEDAPINRCFSVRRSRIWSRAKRRKSSVWEICWHNDEDFFVHLVDEKEFERAKYCESCKLAFPRKNPKCGYDLVVAHKERYQKPNISQSGKRLSPIITDQLGRKFYCVKNDCLLKRHSYFWKGMLFMRKHVSVKLPNKYFQHQKEQIHFEMGRIVWV